MTMGGDLNALSTFPITWWIGHQDAESEPKKHGESHYPYARRVRRRWQRQGDGCWVSSSKIPSCGEVFCEQCGDTDGPPAAQPEPAQRIRGPYPSKHEAEHIATKHFEEIKPA